MRMECIYLDCSRLVVNGFGWCCGGLDGSWVRSMDIERGIVDVLGL